MFGIAYGRIYLFRLCISHITDLPFMKGRLGIDYPELVVVRSGCLRSAGLSIATTPHLTPHPISIHCAMTTLVVKIV